MKLKILFCTEFTQLSTGYSIYSREVISRLYNKYDITEFASYAHPEDPRINQVPWDVYPVLSDDSPTAQFGDKDFEQACLDVKPHCVVALRDPWMDEFISRSPFRSYYNWVWMPTVDALFHSPQWLSLYNEADTLFTYQDWSKQLLESYGLNVMVSAPPAAADDFKPIPQRDLIKKQLGLEGFTIIGTVMRNQRRKLYPQLFQCFRKILNRTQRNDLLLYCHTSYPDMGWDIPKLLLEHQLSSKVLFTYVCGSCQQAFPSFFNDAIMYCPKCGQKSSRLANVKQGVPNEILCRIYNLMDFYVQLSLSEGFGIPIIEAAKCGVPVLGTDYSAMEDVIRKIKGVPIKVNRLELEPETNRYFGIPDSEDFISHIIQLLSISKEEYEKLRLTTKEAYEENYNWDKTAEKWMKYFDSLNPNDYEKKWKSPPRIHRPSNEAPQGLNNYQFAKWLITDVLGEPERLGTYMEARLIRDLTYEASSMVVGGAYYNEFSNMSNKPNYQPFDRQKAYEHMVNLCYKRNHWEQLRCQNQ